MTNKDLIRQYVDTGVGIPRYQFDKISNQDKKTYLRKIYMGLDYEPNNIKFYYAELPEEKQLGVVKKDGNAIEYIKNPSEAVQLGAMQQDGDAIKYIKNPTPSVLALHKQLYGG